jgi:glyoxylase-like metal-dependent hydrolase (beta-lactamase superfamily II)
MTARIDTLVTAHFHADHVGGGELSGAADRDCLREPAPGWLDKPGAGPEAFTSEVVLHGELRRARGQYRLWYQP